MRLKEFNILKSSWLALKEFFHEDGIDKAIAMDLYRQPYCGCIYSEQERYDKKLQKKMRRERELEKAESLTV